MTKLIATDIDGTLLTKERRQISPAFFAEARRLMDLGYAFCAASGRQYDSLRRLFAPIADEIYYLCENGAAVFGPGNPGPLLSKTVMDRHLSLALCHEILERPDCEILISGTNMSYLCPKQPDIVDHMRYFVGNNVTILASPEEMPEDFLKISAYCRSGAASLAPIMVPRWGSHFHVAVAGIAWLDFTLADKGTGIQALCKATGIPAAQTIAFGDNYNDVPMLDLVGKPFIMESAAQPLLDRYPNHCADVPDILSLMGR